MELAICIHICFVNFYCLFIHSSIDWCLNCFHFLAIMNNAAMHIHWQAFVWINVLILLDIYLGTKLFAHMITLSLIFWGTGGLFSKWLCHFTTNQQVWQLQFHYIFFFICFCLLYYNHFCVGDVVSHCSFDLFPG